MVARTGSGTDSGAAATLSDDTPAASSDCSQSVQVPKLLCHRSPGSGSPLEFVDAHVKRSLLITSRCAVAISPYAVSSLMRLKASGTVMGIQSLTKTFLMFDLHRYGLCTVTSARSSYKIALGDAVPQTSGSDECQLAREAAAPSVLPVHTVYVGNLAATVNERHLWDAFGVCGRIRSLQASHEPWLRRAHFFVGRTADVAQSLKFFPVVMICWSAWESAPTVSAFA